MKHRRYSVRRRSFRSRAKRYFRSAAGNPVTLGLAGGLGWAMGDNLYGGMRRGFKLARRVGFRKLFWR